MKKKRSHYVLKITVPPNFYTYTFPILTCCQHTYQLRGVAPKPHLLLLLLSLTCPLNHRHLPYHLQCLQHHHCQKYPYYRHLHHCQHLLEYHPPDEEGQQICTDGGDAQSHI